MTCKSRINAYGIIIILGLHMNIFSQQNAMDQVMSILLEFSKDYETDVTLESDVTFGVKVDNDFWTVTAIAKKESIPAKVTVTKGRPEVPTFYFVTNMETLLKIQNNQLNALTGSAKAFSNEYAPFDMDVMEGFQPDKNFIGSALKVLFHYWTKGKPEIIPYGIDFTRMTHGAQASIFYYQPGFRSGYVALKKGQHANENEKSKTNPFPTLFIAIKGEATMIIDGQSSILKEGNAVLIPPNVKHEFLNPNEMLFEAILLMFGEGA